MHEFVTSYKVGIGIREVAGREVFGGPEDRGRTIC